MTKTEILNLPVEEQYAQIKEAVFAFVKSRSYAPEITEQSRLTKDLGLDSLDRIEMVIAIERPFGICIPDEKVNHLKTVGDMIEVTLKYVRS